MVAWWRRVSQRDGASSIKLAERMYKTSRSSAGALKLSVRGCFSSAWRVRKPALTTGNGGERWRGTTWLAPASCFQQTRRQNKQKRWHGQYVKKYNISIDSIARAAASLSRASSTRWFSVHSFKTLLRASSAPPPPARNAYAPYHSAPPLAFFHSAPCASCVLAFLRHIRKYGRGSFNIGSVK